MDPSPAEPETLLPDRNRGLPQLFGQQLAGLTDVLGLLLVLGILIILFGLLSRNFWTLRTLQSVVNQVPDLLVVAVGMTLVLIGGGIDLSVGSVLALSGAVLGIAMTDWGWPLIPAVAACLAVGAVCGLLNGLVSVLLVDPLVHRHAGDARSRAGVAYLVTDSQTKYIGPRIERVAQPLAGLGVSPAFLAAIALVLIGQVLLARTVWGRYIVAVGANEQAARFSGIATRRIRLTTFVLSGLMAALGAVFQVGRLSSADPNGGSGMELAAIAAVVIGGTSLMGGQGSVFKSFLGVLIVAVLQAGLAQVGATEPVKRVITGAVIVLAVVADVHRGNWTRATTGPGIGSCGRSGGHVEREVSLLSGSSMPFSIPPIIRQPSSLAFLILPGFPDVQERLDRLAQKRIEARRVEVFGGMADDRDLLKGADVGDFQPRQVTEHRRFTFVKSHQIELIFERPAAECVLGNEESQGDDPFG